MKLYLTLAFTLLAANANAQVVNGRIFVRDAKDQAVAAAEVIVKQDSFFTRTTADGKGRFSLHIKPGRFQLTTNALGFATSTSEWFDAKASQRTVVEIPMSPDPTLLAPVVVKARMAIKTGRDGFDYRKQRAEKTGMGMFLGEEELAASNAIFVSDAIRRLPMMRSAQAVRSSRGPTSFTSTPINPQLRSSGGCNGFRYYVDGTRTMLDTFDIDNFLALSDLKGIEVYRTAAEVPGEFNSGDGCSVIAIWTK